MERESIESLKYQLKQWRRLVKYLPPTDCDRDDVAEIEKLVRLGIASQQASRVDRTEPQLCGCGEILDELRDCPQCDR